MIRTKVKQGDVYINARDLIKSIENHKKAVVGDKATAVSQGYELAHDHIIEIIKIYTEVDDGVIR